MEVKVVVSFNDKMNGLINRPVNEVQRPSEKPY